MNGFVNMHGFCEPRREKDIFDKIFLGEAPGVIVMNSLRVGAIMSNKASQPGHMLLLPKRYIESWSDLSSAEMQAFNAAQALLILAQEEVYTGRYGRELVSGFELPRYHKHLIPVAEGPQITIQGQKDKPETSMNERETQGGRIKSALKEMIEKKPYYQSLIEGLIIPTD